MTFLETFLALETLNLIALLGVVFIGLPHGAMDGALAVHFGWMGRPAKAAVFLLAYVGLAALVVAAWAMAPVLSFIAFLAISTYHFGRGDATSTIFGRGAVESIARGGVVIGGISQFHRAEANEVFLTIVGAETSACGSFWTCWLSLPPSASSRPCCSNNVNNARPRPRIGTAFGRLLHGSTAGWLCCLFLLHPFLSSFCFHASGVGLDRLKTSHHPNHRGVYLAHLGLWSSGAGSTISEHRC